MTFTSTAYITRTVTIEGKQYLVVGSSANGYTVSVKLKTARCDYRPTTSQRLWNLAVTTAQEEIAAEEDAAAAKALVPSFENDPAYANSTDPIICRLTNAQGEVVASSRGELQADACVNALVAFGLRFDVAFDIHGTVLANIRLVSAEKAAALTPAEKADFRALGAQAAKDSMVAHAAAAHAASCPAHVEAKATWVAKVKADTISQVEEHITQAEAALALCLRHPTTVDYVVKTAHAYVVFEKGTRRVADKLTFGVFHASRMTRVEALSLAPKIMDGNKVRGTATHITEALRASIAEDKKLLADLRAVDNAASPLAA